MSKLFDMEPQHGQGTSEALRKIQEEARRQEAFDAEAALHVELLTQTDAKLDRINARLDRFSGEINQWSRRIEEAEHRTREKPAAASQPRRSPAAMCALLILGAAAGGLYVTWRDSEILAAREMAGEAVSLSAASMQSPVQEIGSAPAAEPKFVDEPPLLEVTQDSQHVEKEPEQLEIAASQPPAQAPVEPSAAPQEAIISEAPASEPPGNAAAPAEDSPEVVASEPPQIQQAAPQEAVPVSRDTEPAQALFTPSSHGRIQM